MDNLLAGRSVHNADRPAAMEVDAMGKSKAKASNGKGKGTHTDNECGRKGKIKRSVQHQKGKKGARRGENTSRQKGTTDAA